jgi:hypothetical protein
MFVDKKGAEIIVYTVISESQTIEIYSNFWF